MKRILSIAIALFLGSFLIVAQPQKSASNQIETRCGWFHNPTPANISLYDSEAEWIVGVQGGHQVEGDWAWPNFGEQWVKTNINYGYGCACLDVQVEKQTHHIVSIKNSYAKPLKACRQDEALRKWDNLFE